MSKSTLRFRWTTPSSWRCAGDPVARSATIRSWSLFLLIACSVAASAKAQTCQRQTTVPAVHFMGEKSGCVDGGSKPCDIGETVTVWLEGPPECSNAWARWYFYDDDASYLTQTPHTTHVYARWGEFQIVGQAAYAPPNEMGMPLQSVASIRIGAPPKAPRRRSARH